MVSRAAVIRKYHLTHDATISTHGYHSDGMVCGVRVFQGEGLVPVIVLTELPENRNTSVTNLIEYLVAEVLRLYLPDRWEHEPPCHVVEHYLPTRFIRTADEYSLVTFSSWRPAFTHHHTGGSGQRLRVAGTPAWTPIGSLNGFLDRAAQAVSR